MEPTDSNIRGDDILEYTMLRDYLVELTTRNPNTTVKVQSAGRVFKRIYICLGALKQGFKACQRDLLGLDGALMKGPFPGVVLTAVGLDPNHFIYPVAYAIVEAENKDSWTWFLQCLGHDLDLQTNSSFTFISHNDTRKGIIQALATVFPSAEHKYCLRHIHKNMKKQWNGNAYKNLLWKCASATTVPQFQRAMDDFKKFNPEAHAWLCKIPPLHWARSHFSGRAHCHVLLNDMCEVFNGKILCARDKPIITCLEYIRYYCMKRILIVVDCIDKCDGPLTPTATNLFKEIKDQANQYNRVIWNGGDKYQVGGPRGVLGDQCVVDSVRRTCTCRNWEITGMPCKHAVAAYYDMCLNGRQVGEPESWVHPCYLLETWKQVYRHTIQPINGDQFWVKSAPPVYHKQLGSPPKNRKRAPGENEDMVKNGKLSRSWTSNPSQRTTTQTPNVAIGSQVEGNESQTKRSTGVIPRWSRARIFSEISGMGKDKVA